MPLIKIVLELCVCNNRTTEDVIVSTPNKYYTRAPFYCSTCMKQLRILEEKPLVGYLNGT